MGQLTQPADHLVGHIAVNLDGHDGLAALLRTGQAEIADVRARVGHGVGDGSDDARGVLMQDNEGVVLSGELDFQTVDVGDDDVAAADGCADHAAGAALFAGQFQNCGVGMGAGDGSLVEFVGQSLLACELERVTQTGIVGMHVQNARDNGLVGAVTAVGLGERAAQALTGRSPRILRVTRPRRHAPAVCELEGPIITGPMISNTCILCSFVQNR